eukprot:253404_1
MSSKRSKYDYLITGYLRNSEINCNVFMPPDVIKIIYKFYARLLQITLYDHLKFKISRNGTKISGCFQNGGSANHNPRHVYSMLCAQSFKGDIKRKGIYFWSVQNNTINSVGEFIRNIGVTTDSDITYSKYNDNTRSYGRFASYYDGNLEKKKWKQSEIMTVKLNYKNWSVTYYNDINQVKYNKIKKRKTYYFALQLSAWSNT